MNCNIKLIDICLALAVFFLSLKHIPESHGKKNDNANQVDAYLFDVEKCKTYALKNGCYKPGAKIKT